MADILANAEIFWPLFQTFNFGKLLPKLQLPPPMPQL